MFARVLFIIFQIIAGLSSIAGWLFIFFSDKTNRMIALVLMCVCLLSLFLSLIFALFYYVKVNNPAPHIVDSIYAKLEYVGPSNGNYDFFKSLQNKRIFMSEYSQFLNWTGSAIKNVTSALSDDVECKQVAGSLYKFRCKFKRPLLFNQMTTIHLNMDLEDAFDSCQPWLSQDIKLPANLLYMSVVLKYKPQDYAESAKVTKMPIDKTTSIEEIWSIPFDQTTKSYTFKIQPEPGYSYRMQWKK